MPPSPCTAMPDPGAAENMMSGRVHVRGLCLHRAGASAHGGLLIIDGDASLRCGISLKGADIVVGGSVGSFSAFMAQAGPHRHLRRRRRCTRRFTVRGGHLCARQGPLARRRRAIRGHDGCRSRRRQEPAGRGRTVADPARIQACGVRARACITGMPMPVRSIDHERERSLSETPRRTGGAGYSSSKSPPAFDRSTIDYIQRAAASGLYEIRGLGAKRRRAEFRRPAVSRRLPVALSARGLSRALRDQDRARHALRDAADRARHSDHGRRHELRRAVGAGQGCAGPRRDRGGHLDHHRRRRHDHRGAGLVEDPGLPVPAVALRVQSRRRAARGRHRNRHRPGRQARRRRHAAGTEGQSAGRAHAHPARGRRSALGVAPSRTGPDPTIW